MDIGAAAAAIALASTGLFTGAALFISAVEHPAELEHGVSSFYTYFPAMYKRAAKLQGGLSFLGAHAAMIAAAKTSDHDAKMGWRLSGLLIGAVFPFTMLAMMPTNKTILKQARIGLCMSRNHLREESLAVGQGVVCM
eukprot:gene10941-11095_t